MALGFTPQQAAHWIAVAVPFVRPALIRHYANLCRAEDPRFDVEAFASLVDAQVTHLRAEAETLFPTERPPSKT